MTRYLEPFPHFVEDDYLAPDIVRRINQEWPEDIHLEAGAFTVKRHTTDLPPTARQVVDDLDIAEIEDMLGIRGLFIDPELNGGGLHAIPRGGFLKMHVDFNAHPEHRWHRRANVLIYLNEDWRDDWHGHLCLGKNREKMVAPIAGRRVVFETTEESWHGHPKLLTCPKGVERRSIAVYLYTEEPPDGYHHTTVYIK